MEGCAGVVVCICVSWWCDVLCLCLMFCVRLLYYSIIILYIIIYYTLLFLFFLSSSSPLPPPLSPSFILLSSSSLISHPNHPFILFHLSFIPLLFSSSFILYLSGFTNTYLYSSHPLIYSPLLYLLICSVW